MNEWTVPAPGRLLVLRCAPFGFAQCRQDDKHANGDTRRVHLDSFSAWPGQGRAQCVWGPAMGEYRAARWNVRFGGDDARAATSAIRCANTDARPANVSFVQIGAMTERVRSDEECAFTELRTGVVVRRIADVFTRAAYASGSYAGSTTPCEKSVPRPACSGNMRAIRAEQLGNVAQHFSNCASGVADRDAGSDDASGRVVAMTPVRAKAVTGADAMTPVRSKTVTRADAMTRGSRHQVESCGGLGA
jgi:hypothetical protein